MGKVLIDHRKLLIKMNYRHRGKKGDCVLPVSSSSSDGLSILDVNELDTPLLLSTKFCSACLIWRFVRTPPLLRRSKKNYTNKSSKREIIQLSFACFCVYWKIFFLLIVWTVQYEQW